MNKLTTLILFLLVNSVLFSQESFYYSGRVIDNISQTTLEKATLKVNDQFYTLNILGQFRLLIQPGDTITFSHLGYKPYQLNISDSTNSENLPRTIELLTESVTLDEVEVNNYVLTDEMIRNAQRNAGIAVQQAQESTNPLEYDVEYTPPPSGTGMSSSQMFGLNLIPLIGKVKSSKNRPAPLPAKKVISYEEYKSSLTQSQELDSIGNK